MIGFKSARNGGVAALVLALGALIAGVSGAQDIVQPPVISAVDANGVNLATGQFQLPGLDVAIGGSNSSLSRVTQNLTDNFSDVGTIVPINATCDQGGCGGPVFLYVSYAGTTHRFFVGTHNTTNGTTYAAGPYPEVGGGSGSMSCTGSNASGTCTIHFNDGTQAVYSSSIITTGGWGAIVSATKPDGEALAFNYFYNTNGKAIAIKSVTSSLGWMIHYGIDASNAVNQVMAINTAAAYCDPTATSCSVSSTFPTALLTTSGATKTISHNGVNVLSYTVSGNVTTLTTPLNVSKVVTTYSSGTFLGRVSSVVVGGQTWAYNYTLNASTGYVTTTVTEPDGKSRSIVVGSDSTIKSTTDEAGRTTTYSYDSNYNVTKILQPDGNNLTGGFTLITYDSSGRISNQQRVPKGGASNGAAIAGAALITSYGYAACDGTNDKWCRKPTSVTDANGVTTTYTYDANSGEVWTATLPAPASGQARPKTTYTYSALTPYVMNASGALVAQSPVYLLTSTSTCRTADDGNCVNGSDEKQTLISYASNNLLPTSTTVRIGDGTYPQTTTTTYDDNGEAIVVDGPKSGAVDETYSFYDALGRVQGTVGVDPDGAAGGRHRQASHTYYDNDGHVSEVDTGIVGAGNIDAYSGSTAAARWAQAQSDWNSLTIQERNTNAFDGYGRPVVARHYIGTSSTAKDVTQRSYDSMQRLDCEAVRLNPSDYASLPSSACTLGTANADGSHDRITKYAYDALGNLTSTTSAYGTSLARIDASKTYDIASATGSGVLQYVTDAKGNKTSYAYDGFNRLIETCYPTASNGGTSNASDCDQTVYRTTTLSGASQASSLVDHVILRDGQTIAFAYDLLGRVSGKSGAVSESFAYDNYNDVVTHVNNTTGGSSSASESYGYNALGWRTSDAQPISTIYYGYDAYGRRSSMTYPGSFVVNYAYDNSDELTDEAAPSMGWHFDYDDYGRRIDLVRANGVTTYYTYDSNLRLQTLTQGTSGANFYNQVTYGYNSADQISSKAGTNAGYDYPATANSNSYGIDGLNRISSVNGGASFSYDDRGNLTGDGGTGTYSYNANNLMTSATQSGVTTSLTYDAENRLFSVSNSGTTTEFLYDGTDLIAEYDGTGNLLRRYVHGPGIDEPLAAYDYQNGGAYTYLHADDNGSVVLLTNSSGASVTINTYDPYGLPASSNMGRFQYTGQVWLPELKMYYFKARLYSPIIGRFMQTDPIGYADGMNWYAYVHNDPVNHTDPLGLQETVSTCSYENHSVDKWDGGEITEHEYSYILVTGCGGPQTYVWDENPQCQPSGCNGGTDTNYGINRPNSHNYNSPKAKDGKCSALQAQADKLADAIEYAGNAAGWWAAGAWVAAGVSAVGEAPSLGADTPVTAGAASVALTAGTLSYIAGGASAALRSYAQGNTSEMKNFLAVEFVSAGTVPAIEKLPLIGRQADLLGALLEKGLNIATASKEAGCN